VVLWRISRHLDLSGEGGLLANARWHSIGHAVVYLGESPTAALLEVCVHTTADRVPKSFTLLRIEGPDVEISSILPDTLPSEWVKRPELTQRLGTAWLQSGAGVLLRVPSAIVPHTSNYLFNPLHPLAGQFRVVEAMEYPFDGRIKQ
jgi:RES domain-containing protein